MAQAFCIITSIVFWLVILAPNAVVVGAAGRMYGSAEDAFWRGYAQTYQEPSHDQ